MTARAAQVAPASAPADKPAPDRSGEQSNRRILKAIVLGTVLKEELTTGQTKELPPDDMLTGLTADGRLIAPPFDKLVLAMLPEQSTELGQVIDAMVTNIDGFGHRLESRIREADPELPKDMRAKVMEERARLTNFFNTCCQDHSFNELRKRTRKDIESTGEGYWEVIRVPSTGEIVEFNHIPSYQVALGILDKTFTKYEQTVPWVNPDGSVQLKKIPRQKRFRPFIQMRASAYTNAFGFSRGGWEIRWFKEFGDPRVINNRTGLVVDKKEDIAALPEDHKAGELIHFKIYSPRTPYGMPRYIGNLITLFGDRAADEVNYVTLKNNNIPSMMILVSNGQLTDGSINRITEFAEGQMQGSANMSRFLVIEAEGAIEGDESGHVKLDIKPLTGEQMRDQLFQEYGKFNREKIRENFRLPPIFVGSAEDYTRATAESSIKLADEQVFSPDRDEFDITMNQRILPELGVLYHDFVSNTPNVTADEDLTALMDSAERSGAMTPRLGRRIVADILSIDEHALPPLDPSIKPDVPYSYQMAEAVKNMAEPSHQLAVKSSPIYKELLLVKQALDEQEVKRRRDARRSAR